jgi:hypothetical protein
MNDLFISKVMEQSFVGVRCFWIYFYYIISHSFCAICFHFRGWRQVLNHFFIVCYTIDEYRRRFMTNNIVVISFCRGILQIIVAVFSSMWFEPVCYCDLFRAVLWGLTSDSSSFIVYCLPRVRFIDFIISLFLTAPFYNFIYITVVHCWACAMVWLQLSLVLWLLRTIHV